MEIKVKCICGSTYSFEEVPVNGRVAFPVSCTNCGADGTESPIAADDLLADFPEPPGHRVHPALYGALDCVGNRHCLQAGAQRGLELLSCQRSQRLKRPSPGRFPSSVRRSPTLCAAARG